MTTHRFTVSAVLHAFKAYWASLFMYIVPIWFVQMILTLLVKPMLLNELRTNGWALLGIAALGIVVIDLSITLYKIVFAILQNEPVKIREYLMPRRGHTITYRCMLTILGILAVFDAATLFATSNYFFNYTFSTTALATYAIVAAISSLFNVVWILIMADGDTVHLVSKGFRFFKNHFVDLCKAWGLCLLAWVIYGLFVGIVWAIASRFMDTAQWLQEYQEYAMFSVATQSLTVQKIIIFVLVSLPALFVGLLSLVIMAKMYLYAKHKTHA